MKKGKQLIIDDFNENDKVGNESFNIWDYKNQNEIIGLVEEIGKGNFGGQKVGLITNDDEDLVYLPELTALNTKLKNLEKGNKVKIVYKGEEKSKTSGRYYNLFEVQIKR